ncbi:pilus assembly protein [Microbulbifer sp. JMSA003]|uniref:pilus assembly protein n=1 Tax=Microbulbifer sp. JMSA003 TaxID=3243369 RepID=UPI00403A09A2
MNMKKKLKPTFALRPLCAVILMGAGVSSSAAPGVIADIPLYSAGSAPPNIMFVLDSSGSMQQMLYPPEGYNENDNIASGCTLDDEDNDQVYFRVDNSTGEVEFNLGYYWKKKLYRRSTWHTWTDNNCFKSSDTFDAFLYAGGDENNFHPTPDYFVNNDWYHSIEDVDGNFLNWFFSKQDTSGNYVADTFLEEDGITVRRTKLGVERRTDGMKTAAVSLIEELSDVRVGLMQFNDTYQSGKNWEVDGAKLITALTDLSDENTVATAKADLISEIKDISAAGSTPLAESFAAVGRYFISGYTNAELTYVDFEDHDGDPRTEEVEVSAQATAGSIFAGETSGSSTTTILNWNGIAEPTAASSPIQYYCQQNFMVALTDGEPTLDNSISSILSGYDKDCNDNVGKCTTDEQMDDVVKALYDIDLRPDLKDLNGDPVHNNITSYIIGFAEGGISDTDLMKNAGALGGGGVYTANNASGLADTFNVIMQRMRAITGSSGTISFNSTSLESDTLLFNAKFNSGQWRGYLSAWELSEDGKSLATSESWEAGALLDARENIDDRLILTYKNGSGAAFTSTAVGSSGTLHNSDLSINSTLSSGTTDNRVADRIAYLRGDRAGEGGETDEFRIRESRLGDIVNSSPIYVGKPSEGWSEASFPGNDSYQAFVEKNTSRTPMVYVGANDGFLHGFNAKSTGADMGQEIMAYLPAAVLSATAGEGVHALSSQFYGHEFYVDGTPTVRDVYIDDEWKSILVGGLGAGGKGYFALDVTDPSKFSADNADSIVLWEFSNATNLGFTFSRPQIGRLPNGKWAAIFGNGYNSSSGDAGLFIVYLDGKDKDGDSFKYISTGIGSSNDQNGLSSPAIADENKDGTIDRIYAGDLRGNMWAFDVSDESASNWAVAGNAPLFSAPGKAITAAPALARNDEAAGLIVAFGTGQYLVAGDTTDLNAGTYYVIADNNKYSLTESDLQLRTLVLDDTGIVPIRTVEGEEFTWETKSGWYMPLQVGSGTIGGERVISRGSVQGNKIYFNTIIPSGQMCAAGGSGWLMSTNLFTGLVGDDPGLDGDRNGRVDEDDSGTAGVYIDGKMPGESGFIGKGQWVPMSDGNPIYEPTDGPGAGQLGRLSWEEIIPE